MDQKHAKASSGNHNAIALMGNRIHERFVMARTEQEIIDHANKVARKLY